MIQIYYSHIPVSVDLRIDGGSSAGYIIVRNSNLLYYPRVYGEFRLAWPRPCGIDVKVVCLDSRTGPFADFQADGSRQVVVGAELKACSSNEGFS